jgi:hypothetical protein
MYISPTYLLTYLGSTYMFILMMFISITILTNNKMTIGQVD